MPPPRITIRNLHADLAASAGPLPRGHVGGRGEPRAWVEAALADGQAHYGINTGFGALANKRVPDDQLHHLQRNLLLSHAVGVGEPVPPEITRVMLRLKIHGLGLGYSGVSLPTFRRLLDFDRLDLASRGAEPRQRRRVGRPRPARAPVPAADRPRRVLGRDADTSECRPPTCSARTTCRRSNSGRRTGSRSSTARN